MAHGEFAANLRNFLKTKPGQDVSTVDMANGIDLDFGAKPRRRLNSTISDFVARGELERVDKGVYRYRAKPNRVRPINERAWVVIRARRSVTVEDIQALAGASKTYALELLQTLQRQGVIRHQGNKWVLIKDTVTMPTNTAKADRLRGYRQRQKATLAALDAAMNSLLDARQQVVGLTPPGGGHD